MFQCIGTDVTSSPNWELITRVPESPGWLDFRAADVTFLELCIQPALGGGAPVGTGSLYFQGNRTSNSSFACLCS